MAENCFVNAFNVLSGRPAALSHLKQSAYYGSAASATEFLETISGCSEWFGLASATAVMTRTGCQGESMLLCGSRIKLEQRDCPHRALGHRLFNHLIDQGFIYLVTRHSPNLFSIHSQSTFIE